MTINNVKSLGSFTSMQGFADAGEFLMGYPCVPCTVTCSVGSYAVTSCSSTTDSICSICAAGSFSNTTNAANCTLCPLGSYTSSSGLSACTACSAGATTLTTGATNASQCVCAQDFYKSGRAGTEGPLLVCGAWASGTAFRPAPARAQGPGRRRWIVGLLGWGGGQLGGRGGMQLDCRLLALKDVLSPGDLAAAFQGRAPLARTRLRGDLVAAYPSRPSAC